MIALTDRLNIKLYDPTRFRKAEQASVVGDNHSKLRADTGWARWTIADSLAEILDDWRAGA